MSRDEAVLLDMINAAQRIVDFKQGMDRQGFLEDAKTQSADRSNVTSKSTSLSGPKSSRRAEPKIESTRIFQRRQ